MAPWRGEVSNGRFPTYVYVSNDNCRTEELFAKLQAGIAELQAKASSSRAGFRETVRRPDVWKPFAIVMALFTLQQFRSGKDDKRSPDATAV